MEIYSHKLPDELYALIKDKDEDNLPFISVNSISKLLPPSVDIFGGFFGGMPLFSVDTIKRESRPEHLQDLGSSYAISSSKLLEKPVTDLHILDADNALCIAGNHDEETIALDYRIDSLNPRVLGSFHPNDWVLLADSFSEFAKKVGL